MADNIRLNEGVGGALLASDEVSINGVTVQAGIMKISTGAKGAHDNFVDDASPMPVSAMIRSDLLMAGTTALTPKFAAIDAAGSGDNTLVAAVTGKKIRVLAASLQSGGTKTTARFEDGAGGTALTGQYTLEEDGAPLLLPFNPAGWFETTAATLLNLELGGAIQHSGCLIYVEV
jgi:hypothetical protein